MKLNSFKFQDGKVLWLPEYPEEVPIQGSSLGLWKQYDMAVAQSLASAIEVAPEDVNDFKLLWERTYRGVPMSGEVYSAECEMEIKTVYEPLVSKFDLQFGKVPIGTQLSVARQIARLKLKDEFPAANSHDMKEGLK